MANHLRFPRYKTTLHLPFPFVWSYDYRRLVLCTSISIKFAINRIQIFFCAERRPQGVADRVDPLAKMEYVINVPTSHYSGNLNTSLTNSNRNRNRWGSEEIPGAVEWPSHEGFFSKPMDILGKSYATSPLTPNMTLKAYRGRKIFARPSMDQR